MLNINENIIDAGSGDDIIYAEYGKKVIYGKWK